MIPLVRRTIIGIPRRNAARNDIIKKGIPHNSPGAFMGSTYPALIAPGT